MKQKQITIGLDRDDLFTNVIAGLVRNGLTFDVQIEGQYWVIELTGGY